MFAFPIEEKKDWCQWAWYKEVFSKEECERIKNSFSEKDLANATTGRGRDLHHRNTDVQFIDATPGTIDIFKRLAQVVKQANNRHWNFDLSGLYEGLQLTRYREGQFYKWHQDSGGGTFSKRKLSIVVQLSDPKDYEGGELQFLGFEKEQIPLSQGTAIIFPSFNPHQVTPVRSGVRYSLVAWVSGAPYR